MSGASPAYAWRAAALAGLVVGLALAAPLQLGELFALPVVAAPAPSGSAKPAKRVQTKKQTKGGVPMWENY